jgi:hypothetical protein
VPRRDTCHHVGAPVFAGTMAASAIGLFVIPTLYVTFQILRERFGRLGAPRGETD